MARNGREDESEAMGSDIEENALVRPPTGMVEEAFADMAVPSWKEQVTWRAIWTSVFLSVVFNIIVCKLNLTTGVIPSLNVAAGLLGFTVIKIYTSLLDKAGVLQRPFTRQENTVIQTCVVASSGIAFSSGTASYLLGMSPLIASQAEQGNTPINVKTLSLGWMIGFLFVVSFVGLFSIVALRKLMIMKFKLTYPSGTATAYLINSFHTPTGARLATKQVWLLFKSMCSSFVFAFFQWFFTGGDGCGFSSFPTFGLQAYARRFYFDFSLTYVGVGMICPYMVNVSLLIGAILSWGIMWPLIETKKGDWFAADLSPSSLHGIQGYRVFISIAMMLGDGLFHFVYLICKTVYSLCSKVNAADSDSNESSDDNNNNNLDETRRKEYFLKDQIPIWGAVVGYLALALLSTISVPHIFPQLLWHHVMLVYIAAPVLAFCNAYGCGLTDWSLASTYGKLAIFTIGAWAGKSHGGVIAGLAACGVMMNIVSTASDLTQDFKTGYLTLASPRSMFVSQIVGTAMGCVISPCIFWLFLKAFSDLGDPSSPYSAPFAAVYRNMAILGVQGFSSLPENCIRLCYGFFAAAVLINVVRDLLRETKFGGFIPIPMAMAIPFYIGPYFAIDMCVGSLAVFVWERVDRAKAEAFVPAVASGLICGDGIWTLPASILAVAGLKPPICMKFLSRETNTKVDSFLLASGLS